MEDLNKQQVILLVILVSFVVSIATGIITTSLLNKAPVEVTRTINQVVERTVETVVPDESDPEKEVVTVKETVVVTEEDRVVDAISKNSGNVVRVYEGDLFRSIGFIRDGKIATLGATFGEGREYKVIFSGGDEASASFDGRDESGSVFLNIDTDKDLNGVSLSSEDLKLGQRVIVIHGINQTVSTGLVSSLTEDSVIVTNINTAEMEVGSVLLNLSGEVVGVLSPEKEFIASRKLFAIVDTSNTAAAGALQ